MHSDSDFFLLALAFRNRLIPEPLFHSLAELALAGRDAAELLRTLGKADAEAIGKLEAEAARRRSGRSTARLPDPAPGSAPPAAAPEPPRGTRYRLGEELGRGGLGQVIEATDTTIGRSVALKLLAPDATPELIERFRHEGRLTGRLEHPNIVPVHELGTLAETGQAYICMKRIAGRNMREVIQEGSWKLRRLVEAFRDGCRAVAYAHSRGVIHRDLKPANIMLGDFGEVLVVDWGIAREHGEGEGSAGAGTARGDGVQTREGQVLGTPSYMSPEQAMGRADQVDELSDVYSLGATLYEILAGVPPFEADTGTETMVQVVRAEPVPPSRHRACPADLEAVCLRAMAKERRDRYSSVAELGEDVEAFLEGTKEAERRERLARDQVGRARAEIARSTSLLARADEAQAAGQHAIAQLPAGAWTEKARTFWVNEDRAESLRRDSAEALAAAEAALETALALVPDSREARALRAELHWNRFLQAERAGDRDGMIRNRRAVERFNDGAFTAHLLGDGSLEVRLGAWSCGCLREGRVVAAEELAVWGYHPWSGRRLDGRPVEAVPGLERGAPERLRVHGPACRRVERVRARAWAFRCEAMDRMLIPCTPGTAGPGAPQAVLDRVYGDSAFRPRGGGLDLGLLPLARRAWPMGSWLLVVAPEAGEPFRVPFFVGREEAVTLDLTAYGAGELPEGHALVPAGTFAWQGDTGTPAGGSRLRLDAGDFLLARFPVTCREYAAFLNDLLAVSPEEAEARAPREADGSGAMWPQVSGAGFQVPTRTLGPGQHGHRLAHTAVDWEESWPTLSVSWADASAFARWKSARDGRLYHLPHEVQWEKAARGPDGRVYPWGTDTHQRLCNINMSHDEGPHPTAVGQYPFDESPYGVRDLGGNARDWCLNDPADPQHANWRVLRGGNWLNPAPASRACYRAAAPLRALQPMNTFRLAVCLRAPGDPLPRI